jgi:hypothetical protein
LSRRSSARGDTLRGRGRSGTCTAADCSTTTDPCHQRQRTCAPQPKHRDTRRRARASMAAILSCSSCSCCCSDAASLPACCDAPGAACACRAASAACLSCRQAGGPGQHTHACSVEYASSAWTRACGARPATQQQAVHSRAAPHHAAQGWLAGAQHPARGSQQRTRWACRLASSAAICRCSRWMMTRVPESASIWHLHRCSTRGRGCG